MVGPFHVGILDNKHIQQFDYQLQQQNKKQRFITITIINQIFRSYNNSIGFFFKNNKFFYQIKNLVLFLFFCFSNFYAFHMLTNLIQNIQ